MRKDGTTPFTSAQVGVAGTVSSHFVTKGQLDAAVVGSGVSVDPGNQLTAGTDLKPYFSPSLLVAPATAVPLAPTAIGSVGVGAKYAREDHVHPKQAETLTTLAYNTTTKALAYTAENGGVTTIDLSALAIDITVTGATYVASTGVLTLLEAGGSSVVIDLSTLKAVVSTNSIQGNGDSVSLQLVGDVAAPGASMIYGTNGAGAKGWYAIPVVPVVASTPPLMDGVAAIGATGKWADAGHIHPTDTSLVPKTDIVDSYVGGVAKVASAERAKDLDARITSEAARAAAAEGLFVAKNGSTPFTGAQGGVTPIAASDLATKGYVDTADTANSTAVATETARATAAESTLTTNLSAEVTRATAAEGLLVKKDGSTAFTGTQSGVTPTAASHLATKGYVDAADASNVAAVTAEAARATAAEATKLALAGGTMTGDIVLKGDATAALHPVTKQQFDAGAAVPATAAPLMDGVAAVGAATKFAREDHVHASDTSRVAVADIDNTLNQTAAGKVLDARQGKVLSDADIASGAVSGNTLTITLKGGGTVAVDVTTLAADLHIVSGSYNAGTKAIDFVCSTAANNFSVPVAALLPVTTTVADITGDGAATPLALAAAGTAGTYGSATAIPIVTTDAKGRVTGVTTAAPSDATRALATLVGAGLTGASTTLGALAATTGAPAQRRRSSLRSRSSTRVKPTSSRCRALRSTPPILGRSRPPPARPARPKPSSRLRRRSKRVLRILPRCLASPVTLQTWGHSLQLPALQAGPKPSSRRSRKPRKASPMA